MALRCSYNPLLLNHQGDIDTHCPTFQQWIWSWITPLLSFSRSWLLQPRLSSICMSNRWQKDARPHEDGICSHSCSVFSLTPGGRLRSEHAITNALKINDAPANTPKAYLNECDASHTVRPLINILPRFGLVYTGWSATGAPCYSRGVVLIACCYSGYVEWIYRADI